MASNPVASAGVAETATGKAYGTPGYRNYVLFSLLAVYTLNFIDRGLIGVVSEPIIREFQLKDWQFGLLSGFGFALTYTLFGIPIARMAERMSRVKIIAYSVILWSVMTALCGIANGFLVLLLFRVGVGIGEAGCTPPANSIIADYFPPAQPRPRARHLCHGRHFGQRARGPVWRPDSAGILMARGVYYSWSARRSCRRYRAVYDQGTATRIFRFAGNASGGKAWFWRNTIAARR